MICWAQTHAREERAFSTRDKNETRTTHKGRKDEQQYWCLIKYKYRKRKEQSGSKNWENRDSKEGSSNKWKSERKGRGWKKNQHSPSSSSASSFSSVFLAAVFSQNVYQFLIFTTRHCFINRYPRHSGTANRCLLIVGNAWENTRHSRCKWHVITLK